MRRIAIVGASGAGKSTYARELAALTRLPAHHMDGLLWRGKWDVVPEAQVVAGQAALIAAEEWIIEGYIDPALAERARAADLVIDLDFSGARCAWRVVARWVRHRRRARPELAAEALERLDLRFLWIVLSRAERPAIDAALAGVEATKIRRVTSPDGLRRLTRVLVG